MDAKVAVDELVAFAQTVREVKNNGGEDRGHSIHGRIAALHKN
jgi:hypothetical protein